MIKYRIKLIPFHLFIVNEKYIAAPERASLLNQLHASSLTHHLSDTDR